MPRVCLSHILNYVGLRFKLLKQHHICSMIDGKQKTIYYEEEPYILVLLGRNTEEQPPNLTFDRDRYHAISKLIFPTQHSFILRLEPNTGYTGIYQDFKHDLT